MNIVVSDTSPIHYLILCGAVNLLPKLFERVVIPPTVFEELQQPNTPASVREWAADLPPWCSVQSPGKMDLQLDIDEGELQAICLAKEINAAAVLMDDRAGRIAAARCGLIVIGTLGLLEQAAARGLIALPETLRKLNATNARLDAKLIEAAIKRDAARKSTKPTT